MKYASAITFLIFLNVSIVISLLYLGNISRDLEKDNLRINNKISLLNDQLKINKIEYQLYTNHNYLKKLHSIYFESTNNRNQLVNTIKLSDIKKNNIENLYKVGAN